LSCQTDNKDGSYGVTQLTELRVNKRKVAKPWRVAVSLRKALIIILGPSSLPVAVAQRNKILQTEPFSVGVVLYDRYGAYWFLREKKKTLSTAQRKLV